MDRGMVLPATLLLILLIAGLGLLLHLQAVATLETTRRVELELKALTLAENGVRVARSVLAVREVPALLAGPDGENLCPEARDPAGFDPARRLDPATWQPDCDDGFPSDALTRFQPVGESGYFLLRFSNNPEEESGPDRDGVVLVRSLGLVPDSTHPPAARLNQLALVEGRFRREYAFEVSHPVTLAGAALDLTWPAGEVPLHSEGAWFGFIETPGASLGDDLARALGGGDGSGTPDGRRLEDLTATFREDPNRRRIFLGEYWSGLARNLAPLAPPPGDGSVAEGLYYLPAGGQIGGEYGGVLWAAGPLILAPGAKFTGLLIHLGNGPVILSRGSVLTGALWMSSLQGGAETASGGLLGLQIEAGARIAFSPEEAREALALVAPTLLQWRILFPEMG